MSHDVNDVQLLEGEATSHDVGESVSWNLDPSFAMADVMFFDIFYTLNPAVTVTECVTERCFCSRAGNDFMTRKESSLPCVLDAVSAGRLQVQDLQSNFAF